MLYTVKWEIEVDADSPWDAAFKASSMMPRDLGDPDGATVFEVVPWNVGHPIQQPGDAVFIDLAEQEGD